MARVAEGLPAVDALRAVLDGVATDNFVLLSGDVVSETSLRAQLLTHYVREAAITALLGRRKVPASAETKPGRPPRNVDYIGGLLGGKGGGGGGGMWKGHTVERRKGVRCGEASGAPLHPPCWGRLL